MKAIVLLSFLIISSGFSQMPEGTITRTTSTNSVFPRQFPEMTIRKINEREYWLFESLSTNTIFHRQFPSYIVRRSNYGNSTQKWGVYRTTSTNSVFPVQFPDRYISDLKEYGIVDNPSTIKNEYKSSTINIGVKNPIRNDTSQDSYKGYTYSKTLKDNGQRSYNIESPE